MSSAAFSRKSPTDRDGSPNLAGANDLERELLMPAGEPAVAVLAAALLLGMVWFAGAFGHAARAPSATAVAAHRPSLRLDRGAVRLQQPSPSTG